MFILSQEDEELFARVEEQNLKRIASKSAY